MPEGIAHHEKGHTMSTVTVSILHNTPGASSVQVDLSGEAAANLAPAIRMHAALLAAGMTTPESEAAFRAMFAIARALDDPPTA